MVYPISRRLISNRRLRRISGCCWRESRHKVVDLNGIKPSTSALRTAFYSWKKRTPCFHRGDNTFRFLCRNVLGFESPCPHHFSAEHIRAQLIFHLFHQDSVDFLLGCMREADITSPPFFSSSRRLPETEYRCADRGIFKIGRDRPSPHREAGRGKSEAPGIPEAQEARGAFRP